MRHWRHTAAPHIATSSRTAREEAPSQVPPSPMRFRPPVISIVSRKYAERWPTTSSGGRAPPCRLQLRTHTSPRRAHLQLRSPSLAACADDLPWRHRVFVPKVRPRRSSARARAIISRAVVDNLGSPCSKFVRTDGSPQRLLARSGAPGGRHSEADSQMLRPSAQRSAVRRSVGLMATGQFTSTPARISRARAWALTHGSDDVTVANVRPGVATILI